MIQLRVLGSIDLRDSDGHEIRSILVQPRRLALLVYLALVAPRGFHRRDKLLGLFWPEHDSARARNALSQALHVLRRGIGGELLVNRGDEEVGLVAAGVTCDAVAFEEAIAAGRRVEALELYRGDLLEGFFVDEVAPDLDQWVHAERERLRRVAAQAARALAAESEAQENLPLARYWAQRSVRLAPYDEAALQCFLTILERQGDRSEALLAYEEFERRLMADLGVEPSPEMEALVRGIAARKGAPARRVAEPEAATMPVPAGVSRVTRSSVAWWLRSAAAVLLLALVSRGLVALGRGSAASGSIGSAEVGRSVAVLPFVNISREEDQEAFVDGMTEALLDALARVEGLKVTARTSSFSFKGKGVPVDSIGRALNVAHVVEGSVRKSGNRLIISARLVDAENGYKLWSESYDREMNDAFAIQEEIAQAVTQALRVKLSGQTGGPLVDVATKDRQAYELYLRGRYGKLAAPLSTRYYEEAIGRDSQFVAAYVALASSYRELPNTDPAHYDFDTYLRKSRRAIDRALELDPSKAEARAALGEMLYTTEWDFAGGEREVRQAIRLNPNYSAAYSDLAQILVHSGRTKEGLASIRHAEELDPLRPQTACMHSYLLLHARRYQESLQQHRLADEKHDVRCGEAAIEANYMLGRHRDALDAAKAFFQRERDPEDAELLVRMAEDVLGAKMRGQRPRSDLVRAVEQSGMPVERLMLAKWYAWAGDNDDAFRILKLMVSERGPQAVWITFPYLDALRADPRYQELVAKMNLPAAATL
jgi:TolB-like protein/DNA-binding SARP family transcriptional activator/Flp pilus assembly protein TadD